MPARECIVVGGGLGGLSAALALAKSGRKVRLLERANIIEPIGYGIQLGPNIMPIFEQFGVLQEVYNRSHFPSAIQMLDWASAKVIGEIPLGDRFRERFHHRYVCIHRGDIHNILLDACRRNESIDLRTDVEIVQYRQEGERVVALSSTEAFEADILVGADGINSRIRTQMHPESALQPISYVAHRTIIPFKDVPSGIRQDQVVMWAGPGCHVIYYPLPGHGLNIVGVFSQLPGDPEKAGEARRAQLLERCKGGQPEMLAALGMMDFKSRWDLADRKPMRNWADGNVCLLGDAVHATFQSLAQGACMAIEDAVVLADCLQQSPDDVRAAFKDYERKRITRTARVQLESRSLWSTYHAGGIEALVRDAQFEGRTPEDFYNCMSWVWAGIRR